jgi:CRP-like cAMP-binding protein
MEKVPPGEAVLDQGEVPEWVGLAEEGWVVRGRVQVLRENASVQNVGRLLLMKSEHPVPL